MKNFILFSLLIILMFSNLNLFSQRNKYFEQNKHILDSLKQYYAKDCDKDLFSEIPSKKLRLDLKAIKKINQFYRIPNDSKAIYDYLKTNGFREHSARQSSSKKAEKIYSMTSNGNLNFSIILYFDSNLLVEKKILVVTNSKFYCRSKSLVDVISYIDFVYLNQYIISEIKFPVKVNWTNVELISD